MDKDAIRRIINGGRAAWQFGRVVAPIATHLAATPLALPVPQPAVPDPQSSPTHSLIGGPEETLTEQAKQLAQHRKQQLEDERRRAIELGLQLREPTSHQERERER